jgi:hypothetical protein
MRSSRSAALAAAAALAALGACANTDETSYFVRERIRYTGPAPLDDVVAGGVVIVGSNGAVDPPGGTLEVVNLTLGWTAGAILDGAEGSFVGTTLVASGGDEVELSYRPDGGGEAQTLVFALDDPLDAVEPPSPCGSCGGGIVEPPADGRVTVSLSALADPAPPYTIYNPALGDVVIAAAVDPPVTISASEGHEICLFRTASDAAASPTLCVPVTAE